MAIKVLVTSIGQHLLADVKQVEDTDTNEILAYWLKDARLVTYSQNEDGGLAVSMGDYCPVATGGEFSIRRDAVVSILDPREDVLATYEALVNPPVVETQEEEA